MRTRQILVFDGTPQAAIARLGGAQVDFADLDCKSSVPLLAEADLELYASESELADNSALYARTVRALKGLVGRSVFLVEQPSQFDTWSEAVAVLTEAELRAAGRNRRPLFLDGDGDICIGPAEAEDGDAAPDAHSDPDPDDAEEFAEDEGDDGDAECDESEDARLSVGEAEDPAAEDSSAAAPETDDDDTEDGLPETDGWAYVYPVAGRPYRWNLEIVRGDAQVFAGKIGIAELAPVDRSNYAHATEAQLALAQVSDIFVRLDHENAELIAAAESLQFPATVYYIGYADASGAVTDYVPATEVGVDSMDKDAGGADTPTIDDDIAVASAPEWPEVVPLDSNPVLPTFQADWLPPVLSDFAEALAQQRQVPLDFTGMGVLATAAAAAQGRLKLRVDPGWCEALCLFSGVILPPNTHKDGTMDTVTEPLVSWERQMASRGPGTDATPSSPPQVYADDTTPESLNALLAEHGRMFIFTCEGETLDVLMGKTYSKGMRISSILKAYSGTAIRVNRMGRIYPVPNPALSILIAIQPALVARLFGDDELKGRGFVGRFLLVRPVSGLGLRRYRNVPAVPVDVERSYSAALTSVLVKTYALPKEQWVEIALTPAAHEALISFAEWVEPQLHEETGDLRHTGEFAGKLAGNTARMATLMGLAENARMLTPWTVPVSESNMQRAISIARYLIPHAASLCEGPDPTRPKAQSVWQLLKADGRSHITKTDIWQLSRGRFAQIGGLEAVLDLLCRHGFLREREGQRAPGLSNRGRKPCPVYEVNPNATGMEV